MHNKKLKSTEKLGFMKKKLLVSIGVVCLLMTFFQANGNEAGAQPGYSGSPQSSGEDCLNGHSGPGISTETLSIVTDIPAAGFAANTTYNITVTADNNGANSSKIGLSASVEDNAGHQGMLSESSAELQLAGTNFITHTSTGTAAAVSKSWTFQWNSGSAISGTSIYAAANFTNGRNITAGDVVVTSNLMLTMAPVAVPSDLIITGIVDGPLPGGTPKAIEIYVANTVADLSEYSIANANNGGPFTATPFTLPAIAASAGDYIYIASEAPNFSAFFGFAPDYVTVNLNVNGDDAVGLFRNGVLADVYGVVGQDGSGMPWEYLDGWCYRNNSTGPDATFTLSEWIIGGVNTLDFETLNATATNPFPIGTYLTGGALLPQLELTELMPSSALPSPFDEDWFEIANTGAISVDLNGWSWDDNSAIAGTHTFGSLTILPGERIIIADIPTSDVAGWIAEWQLTGQGLQVIGNDAFTSIGFSGLGQNGDGVFLYDTAGQAVDSAIYASGTAGTSITFAGGMLVGPSVNGVNGAFTSLNGADVGSPGDLMPPPPPQAIPTYSIGQLRGVDATGVTDSLNVYARIYGTVFSIDFRAAGGYSFWIKDNQEGIVIFNFNDVNGYNAQVGDSIKAVGTVLQFSGLTQFTPDTIVTISSGNAVSSPLLVSAPLAETDEGDHLRINNVTIVNAAQWPIAGNSANVDLTDGTNTYLVRINSATDIDGSAPPTGPFDIVGGGGQYDGSSPFDAGYQLQPSSLADIIVTVPTVPTVNFLSASQSSLESSGTVTIGLSINPPATSAGTIELILAPGAGLTPADGSTNPAVDPITGILSLSYASGASMVSFDFIIIDDLIIEANESATVDISTTGTSVSVGTLNQFIFTIIDNDTPIPSYNIADVRTVDTDGLPDSLNVNCKLQGVVHGFNLQSPTGTLVQFTIIDNTDGISVFYSLADVAYSPLEGDLVRVVGVINHFNGLGQINADSIVLISGGNTLTTAAVVTALDESTESNLISINNVTLVDPTQWPAPGNNSSVDITDGTNTYILRIDRDTDVDDNVAAPTSTFDVTGLGGQFDNSVPHTDGYQILPRYAQDISLPAPPTLAITEIMAGSNIANAAINGDWWELKNTGTVDIDLAGFSWDDNSYISGTSQFPSIMIAANEAIVIWQGLSADETDFMNEWFITSLTTVISSDELTGSFPALSQNGDGVAIYSPTGGEICRAEYSSAVAGVSVEFDLNCGLIGDAAVGVNGAYSSGSGDIGSPGDRSVSIEESGLLSSKMYPNPSNGKVKIELPSGDSAEIHIINTLGVEVYSGILENGKTSFDVSAWAKGFYLVQINKNASSHSIRLLVN